MFLTSVDPFMQEFERQFDRIFRLSAQNGAAVMPMDGVRRKDDVLLRFDLPGIEPDSVDVTVDRGVLSVSAQRDEKHSDDDRIFVRERMTGTFTRRVYLPEYLDADKISASYDNGVLTVSIPVLEKAKPRRIAINGGRKALKA